MCFTSYYSIYITFSWLISSFIQTPFYAQNYKLSYTWFQTLAMFWKLYLNFWVIPDIWILCVNVSEQCVCSISIGGVNLHSVPKHWYIKFRRQGITQKKRYSNLRLLMSSSNAFQHTRCHPQGVHHIAVRSSGTPNGYTTQFNHLGRTQLCTKAQFPNKCWQSLDNWWLKASQ